MEEDNNYSPPPTKKRYHSILLKGKGKTDNIRDQARGVQEKAGLIKMLRSHICGHFAFFQHGLKISVLVSQIITMCFVILGINAWAA